MKYGLNDETVKRIAAIAFHTKGGNTMHNISSIYHNIENPEIHNRIAQAHTTDAMQNKFSTKESENSFKVHLAKSAAINRGMLDPVPQVSKSESNKTASPEA